MPFIWYEECEKSSRTLKKKLTKALVLAIPDPDKRYIIFCDTSSKGHGSVLMQGKNVIAYASRQHKTHDENYPTHDLIGSHSLCIEGVKTSLIWCAV